MRLLLIFSLMLALANCGAPRIDMMASHAPLPPGAPSALFNNISVGEVTGGSSMINYNGVSENEFKKAIERSLSMRSLLVPNGQNGRYRIDASINFDESPFRLTIDNQDIIANGTYRLYDAQGNALVFEKTARSSFSTKGPMDSAGPVLSILFDSGADKDKRIRAAYEGAVRNNLDEFMTALSQWNPALPNPASYVPAQGQNSYPAVPITPVYTSPTPTYNPDLRNPNYYR